ncbi:MAG TPA: YXWGXW repeat-containing protein [Rhodoferax sp.]|nr:YXWGXW repeat-containing protein [Rhodoferax sp.]
MKHTKMARSLLLALALAAGGTAFAQISVNIVIAPPAPMYEVVPVMQPGYVWAPGYWAWTNERHVWVRGRTMVQRDGYKWVPDRWEQRNGTYYRQAGRWAYDADAKPAKVQKMKKPKPGKGHGNNGHNGK